MENIGDLTCLRVPELWKHRDQYFSHDKVDLEKVKVDSAGIAFLVQWAKACGKGKLELSHPSEKAKKLIATFKLQELFVMVD